MHRRHVALALVLGLIAGSVAAAGVDAELKTAPDLDAYSTYAWREGTPARREVAEKLIRSGVDRELAAAGLLRASGEADLWVVTHVLVDRHSLADLDDRSYFEFYAGAQSVDAYDVGAGTLVVDLIDARVERIVWRGVVSEAVRGGVKPNLKKIDKAIHRMFKRLPRSSR